MIITALFYLLFFGLTVIGIMVAVALSFDSETLRRAEDEPSPLPRRGYRDEYPNRLAVTRSRLPFYGWVCFVLFVLPIALAWVIHFIK